VDGPTPLEIDSARSAALVTGQSLTSLEHLRRWNRRVVPAAASARENSGASGQARMLAGNTSQQLAQVDGLVSLGLREDASNGRRNS